MSDAPTTPETPAEPEAPAPADQPPAEPPTEEAPAEEPKKPALEAGLRNRLMTALEAFQALHADPSTKQLDKVNSSLQALGLKPIDVTPGPYNPFADPRLGSTAALDKLEVGVAAIDPAELSASAEALKNDAGEAERWAAVFGTVVMTAIRVGAAFV